MVNLAVSVTQWPANTVVRYIGDAAPVLSALCVGAFAVLVSGCRGRATAPPDPCARIQLRSSRGELPRRSVWAAKLPQGTWALHRSGRNGDWALTLRRRRQLVAHRRLPDLFAARRLPDDVSIAVAGSELGVLGVFDDDNVGVLAIVGTDGDVVRGPPIDLPHWDYARTLKLATDAGGNFVAYSAVEFWRFDGARLVGGSQLQDDGQLPAMDGDDWAFASMPTYYVLVHASRDEARAGVGVRWLDDDGAVIDRSTLLLNERASSVSAVARADGVAIAYSGEDGLKLALVGKPGQILMYPTLVDWSGIPPRKRLDDLRIVAFDTGYYWLTGEAEFLRGAETHTSWMRYRSRVGVVRATATGAVTRSAVLRSPTGSRFNPILTFDSGTLSGHYQRDPVGKRGDIRPGRNTALYGRWLTARCAHGPFQG